MHVYKGKNKSKNETQSYNRIYLLHGHTYTVLLYKTGATHTHLHKTQKKPKWRLPLRAPSPSPCPQLPAPPAWSVSSCLAPHVLAARHHGRGFGERTGFSSAVSARTKRGSNRRYSGKIGKIGERGKIADAPSHQRGLGTTPTPANPRTITFSLSLHTVVCTKGPLSHRRLYERSAKSRPSPRRSTPFVAWGSAPSLRPVLCSTPLRGASRKVSSGGVPPPWPRHTAHPPIGSELPHPSPSHQARRDSGGSTRREIQAGDSGGRNLGGKWRRWWWGMW